MVSASKSVAAKKTNSYQTVRNMSLGFAVLAALLIVFGAGFAWRSWQTEKEHELLYLSTIVEITGNSMSAYFGHHERALEALGKELQAANGNFDLARVQTLLKRVRRENPDLRRVNLSLPSGQMVVADDIALGTPMPSLGDTPSFQAAVRRLADDRRLDIGQATRSVFGDEWIIPLRRGVLDGNGRLQYILSAILPVSQQQSFWQDLPLPEESALGLLRDDGYMVSRYPVPKKINYEEAYGKPRDGRLMDFLRQSAFPRRGVTEGYNSVAKADYLFAFHRLADYPLTVFVSTPLANLQVKWWHQAQFSFVLAGLLLVGGFVVYRWSTRRQLAWEMERERSQAKIEFLAHHDPLTELPNRLLAKDRLERAFAYAERAHAKVALLFLDLDNFKTINDSLGHSIGDALLKAVSDRLHECIRDTDTLSRQGGDEYLVILSEVHGPRSVSRVAEEMLQRLAEPFLIEGYELATTLSIGIAIYPDDGRDAETLLKKADTAMYHAKGAGRNTFRFFTERMNIDADERLRVRHWLRRGLERQEFVLHYQPQFDLASGAVIGAEALIRLNREGDGLIPPDRFVSIAEDSGLIVSIGAWVLREACRQAALWRRNGMPDFVIAVNLSAVQFKRGDLERAVAEALAASGLEPSALELELTESILIEHTEQVLATVKRLKAMGIRFAIDDFGTGYSSLAYLKRFNVDKLKIDQSFVRDIVNDPEDAAIVRAIVQMARSLNVRTIAEGVEDEATRAFLRDQQCDEAQGYHFARPLPADECSRFLADYAASRQGPGDDGGVVFPLIDPEPSPAPL